MITEGTVDSRYVKSEEVWDIENLEISSLKKKKIKNNKWILRIIQMLKIL